MLVETYEVPETFCDGEKESDAEALELIEKLDLEGQKSLVSDDGDRCPYRKMTADEATVYGAILPVEVKLKEYSDGPIPLRVLQVASHAAELFDHLKVWHAEDADIKDPILIGIRGGEYSTERFLLARWGEELLPFAELALLAAKKMRAEFQAKLADMASKINAKVEALSKTPDEGIVSGAFSMPAYYE